jgi:hypothetical protein
MTVTAMKLARDVAGDADAGGGSRSVGSGHRSGKGHLRAVLVAPAVTQSDVMN